MSLPTIILKPQYFLNIPKNWKVIKNINFDLKKDLTLFFEETVLKEKEILKRGKLAGLAHANFLVLRQERIPEKWKENGLLFAGTKVRNFDDVLFVPCLDWGDDGRSLSFSWFDYDFQLNHRIVGFSQ